MIDIIFLIGIVLLVLCVLILAFLARREAPPPPPLEKIWCDTCGWQMSKLIDIPEHFMCMKCGTHFMQGKYLSDSEIAAMRINFFRKEENHEPVSDAERKN